MNRNICPMDNLGYDFEERAAIKEFDALMSKEKAEEQAMLEFAQKKYLANKGNNNGI